MAVLRRCFCYLVWVVIGFGGFCGFCYSVSALADEEARALMQRVDDQMRKTSDSTFTQSTLMTCRFGKKRSTDGGGRAGREKIGCIEKPRIKVLEGVEKQYGPNKKDARAVSIVLSPADEKGIGMLTYQYDDPGRDTESWLYLSALGKVKRMVTGSDEEQEPVSFFGSEFTTEDMESGKVDEYRYGFVKREAKPGAKELIYQGRPVVVIAITPTEKKRRKSRYSRSVVWVDIERLVVLKSHIYDKRDQLLKRITAGQFEQINGFWLARKVMVVNVQSQRLSRFMLDKISMGVKVDDEFLTQRTLTDFAFREALLKRLREASQ